MGEMATAEYNALTGCDEIPIEQDGGSGSRCKHWAETCLNNELMTTELDTGSNPLSRITIGGVADLGYIVDFTNAEVFTEAEVNPSCLC